MDNKFKNKNKKTTKQNTNEVKNFKPPHPDCTMTRDELKEMSHMLPTSKLRGNFVYATYFQGQNPVQLMRTMLSDPVVQSELDDMALTGCAPRIPSKFRVRNRRKPEMGAPPQNSRGKRFPGTADPPDNQSFQQQCQRLISNMSNMGATGMIPLAMPGLGVDEIGHEEPFPGQGQFDGRQPRPGQDHRNPSQSGPSLSLIANLPGVDGPLKQEYERLLSNVNKIGGFGNNMDLPMENHPDSSGPGPSAQKRESFHDQHAEPKRGRFPGEGGPAGMQQGPNPGNPRNRKRNRGPPVLDSQMGRPNMPAQMQPRPNMPQFGSEFHGEMPPFNNGPQGNMGPFSDGPQGNMPPFNNGPQGNMPPFSNGPQGNMPPFNSGPQGNMPSFNNGPQGNMPPFSNGPQGIMGQFNDRPQGNMPQFNNGPQGNMPPFNSGPQGNMPPFNNGPQGNIPPFSRGPQGNMPPFDNNGPLGNMQPFNTGLQGNMLPLNNMPHGDIPFNGPQSNMQPFNSGPNGNRQPSNNEFQPPFNQDHGNMHPGLPQRQQTNMPPFRGDDRDMHSGLSRGNPSHQSGHLSIEQQQRSSSNDFGSSRGMRPASDPQPPKISASRDDVSRTEGDPRDPMFIVPIRYPSERFSDKQMDAIENAILEAILEIDDERLKPTFQDSFRSSGRYGVICNDQLSKNWLFSYLSRCRPWPYASFKIISAQPNKIKADALLPLCKNDDNEKILKFIAKQNTKLNVGQWEVVQRLDGACNTTLSLAIDEESANVLKGSSTINFKMGRAEIAVAAQCITGKVNELITRAVQKKDELVFGMSGRSHPYHNAAHSEQTHFNQKPRGMQELCVTGRDSGSERRSFDRPEASFRSREMVQPPTSPPPPPTVMGSAMRRLISSEYGGTNEYEPSRSDRFFRTPSPEPRAVPDTRDRLRQDPDRTAQPYRIPSSQLFKRDSGHSIPVLDSSQNAKREPLQRSSSGSVKSNRIPTIDGNLRSERPFRGDPQPNIQRSGLPIPSRSSRPNFPSRR